MVDRSKKVLSIPGSVPVTLVSLKVEVGSKVQIGTVLATYSISGSESNGEENLRSSSVGKVSSILHQEGDLIQPK